MKVKETQKLETEVVVDVICDSCGKSCNTEYGFECMYLSATWGFDTNKDTQQWSAQICERCVDEKLSFITFLKTRY